MFIRFGIIAAMAIVLTACQSTKTGGLEGIANRDTSSKTEIANAEKPDTTDADKGHVVAQDEKTASVSPALHEGADAANTIARYVPPAPGTIYTWRNNWANLPEIISYKVAGTKNIGGREFLKLTSVKGFKSTTHAYYDTSDFSLKGYRDKDDKAVVTFKPPEQRYRFPMKPGDQWVTAWKQMEHKTSRVTNGGGVVKVMRWETIKTPAGEFRALKVRMPVQRGAPKGLTHHAWFSPELGITVKEEIGGGVLQWSQLLEKIERPNS